jgi:hypothetical protein
MGLINDLIVRIKGDKTSLDSTLNGAEGSLRSFASKAGNWLKAAFSIAAIVEFGKAVINSTEGFSKNFAAAMSGAKEAVNVLSRAIANMDFSHLINGLIEGYKHGRDFAKQLNLLADVKAYDDYVQQMKKARSAELLEFMRDLDNGKAARIKAGNDRLKLEQEIQERSVALAQRTFDLEKKGWEDRTHVEAQGMLDSFEKVQGMSVELQNRLKTAFEAATAAELGSVKQGIKVVLFGQGEDKLTGIPQETIKAYADYFGLQAKEKDALITLFGIYKQLDVVRTESQDRYNAALRNTNQLLKGSNYAPYAPDLNAKLLGKLEGPSLSDLRGGSSDAVAEILGVAPKGGTAGQLKDLGQDKITRALKETNKAIDKEYSDLEKALTSMRDMAVDLGGQVVEALGEALGGGNLQDIGRNLLSGLANFLSQMGMMLISLGLGIQAFIESTATLNPVLAIAAGTAMLVTAGIIKGALSHAKGSTSGSGGGGSSYAGSISTQTIKVQVEGKIAGADIHLSNLRAGNSLIANT